MTKSPPGPMPTRCGPTAFADDQESPGSDAGAGVGPLVSPLTKRAPTIISSPASSRPGGRAPGQADDRGPRGARRPAQLEIR